MRLRQPVFNRGIAPLESKRRGQIKAIDVPDVCGADPHETGDLVFGDREGVYFVPPALVQEIVDRADETHIHDEWTKKKFDEGKYKSREIYGSPGDPALKKEYEEYLKKRREELRAQRRQ